ncbi:DUF885 domain-containing protein, partial [Actinotalea sp. K2]|uniref:DUF885 domain-containing protein n=1 Tax=Actinotalea sp. K2 TaxID=2939438 RepID=UPI002017C725
MTSTASPRVPTAIDAVADAYTTTSATLHPLWATAHGIDGYDHLMTDLSPAGWQARADAARAVLAELAAQTPVDDVDRVTLTAMQERVGVELEMIESDELLGELNVIASPVQALREVFDIMPTTTARDWQDVAARLAALPAAMAGYLESLRLAAARGRVAAARQVTACVEQALELADPETSFFTTLTTGPAVEAALAGTHDLLRRDLRAGADAACQAYADLVVVLRDELLPQAPQRDAVGSERYALWSRFHLGATIDLEETYRWALDELELVIAEQEAVASQVAGPGATIEQAVAVLDADPSRVLEGTAALRTWMQTTSDVAVAALSGTHFDIPGPVLTLECCIAPTQTGGIYYTGPSDDFSRPGRMWWSVPAGVTTFTTWREKTTVYHEGVPGHHLQIAQTVHDRAVLNRWRRLACWVPGHGEGWALYAERLMADLGFLDDPGDRLGMLDGQRLRTARVVLDIGVHLGLPRPQRWGGGVWD